LIRKNPDKLKLAGSPFTDESYGIAVAKGQDELLKQINYGITWIKSIGTIDTAKNKWLK
jgi:polar amino acid transport system substrate-binding protein